MATTLLRVTEELRKVAGRLEKVNVAVGQVGVRNRPRRLRRISMTCRTSIAPIRKSRASPSSWRNWHARSSGVAGRSERGEFVGRSARTRVQSRANRSEGSRFARGRRARLRIVRIAPIPFRWRRDRLSFPGGSRLHGKTGRRLLSPAAKPRKWRARFSPPRNGARLGSAGAGCARRAPCGRAAPDRSSRSSARRNRRRAGRASAGRDRSAGWRS